MPKSEKYKSIMSAVRAKISDAKRRGTKQGSIGYYGCIDICNTFVEILNEAEKFADEGEYFLAFSVVTLVVINNAKLASVGDSSSGCVSDVQWQAEKLMENICNSEEVKGTKESSEIFTHALKDSQNAAFDSWEDFSYSILLSAAKLSTKDNISKLYEALDCIAEKRKKEKYSVYKEWDCLVRIKAIEVVEGIDAAEKYANTKLKYKSACKAAVEMAIEKENYSHAQKLCNEIINERGRDTYWSGEWFELLLEVYDKSGNDEAKINLVHELLVDRHEVKYYDLYKELLQKYGRWEQESSALLDELEYSVSYESFSEILWKENKEIRLLEHMKKYPSIALCYAEKLGTKYSDITYPLCIAEIENQAGQASNRIQYRKICSEIKRLSTCGANVNSLIEKLKENYPKRSALIDELEKLSERI